MVHGCRKNDRVAQEGLYKRFFGLMYHICKDYAADREGVLSLLNEGFLKVFMAIDTFDEHKGSFESWATRIMTNNCIDQARRQKRMEMTAPIADAGDVADRQSADSRIVEKEIMQCLKKLPGATQEVFKMYVFKGFSHKEISESMQIAESTSRWHVMEARKVLKKLSDKIL